MLAYALEGGYPDEKFYITSRMTYGFPGNPNFALNNFSGWQLQSRMPVEYRYFVNDQFVGTSNNVGLTELDIVRIPTSYLRDGLNRIVKQWSTNPGHFFGVTHTEINIPLLPDMRIPYIDNPRTLPNIRSLPDFAIYNENIIISYLDMVSSEANQVNANVANRGSRSGWVDIIATDSSGEQFREEGVFIEAFSIYPIEFDWIPLEGANTITITLENASEWVEERDLENNVASVTVPAREREIPVIGEIVAGEAFADESVIITTDVSNAADVSEITYSINGGDPQPAKTSTLSDGIRASANVIFENEGDHEIEFTVTYNTSRTTTSTVSESATISVLPARTVEFSIDPADATNLQFFLYRIELGQAPVRTPITVNDLGGGYFSFMISSAIFAAINNYFLLVTSDVGAAFERLSYVMTGITLVLEDGVIPQGIVTDFETTRSELDSSAVYIDINSTNTSDLQFLLYGINEPGSVESVQVEMYETRDGRFLLNISDEILSDANSYYLVVISDYGSTVEQLSSVIDSDVVENSESQMLQSDEPSGSIYSGRISLYDDSYRENFGGEVARFRISDLIDDDDRPHVNDNPNAGLVI